MQWGVPLSNGAEKTDRGTPGSQTPIIVYRHKVAPLGNLRLASGLVIRTRIKFETFSFFPFPSPSAREQSSKPPRRTEPNRDIETFPSPLLFVLARVNREKFVYRVSIFLANTIYTGEREREPLKAIELPVPDGRFIRIYREEKKKSYYKSHAIQDNRVVRRNVDRVCLIRRWRRNFFLSPSARYQP